MIFKASSSSVHLFSLYFIMNLFHQQSWNNLRVPRWSFPPSFFPAFFFRITTYSLNRLTHKFYVMLAHTNVFSIPFNLSLSNREPQGDRQVHLPRFRHFHCRRWTDFLITFFPWVPSLFFLSLYRPPFPHFFLFSLPLASPPRNSLFFPLTFLPYLSQVRDSASRQVRNIKTKELMTIPPRKNVGFRSAGELKEIIRN